MENQMEKQQASEGIGLEADVKVNANLKISEVTSVLDMLGSALRETGGTAKDLIAEAVAKLREAGVQNLKKASQKEGGSGQATKTYKRTLNQLQTAADRGDTEASKLLGEMAT